MFPVLIRIGNFHIYTYGVAVATAFIAGVALAMREARRRGDDSEKILDLSLYLIIASILGSRIFYVAFNIGDYLKDPLEILKIWRGGLVFYGGLLSAMGVGIWYLRRHGIDIWKTADTFAPSISLGHGIGRLGCLSAGCCYGKPSTLPWAVTFKDARGLAELGIPIHPTQLYSALNAFAIFGILMVLRRRMMFSGQLFWIYILLYAPMRFLIEFFRGDPGRGFPFNGPLSTSQWVGLFLVPASLVMLMILSQRAKRRSNSGA